MDRGGEEITGVGHTPADDDALDVVGHDEEVHRPGQAATDVIDERGRSGIAGGGGTVHVPRGFRFRAPGDGRSGGKGLETALLTAGACGSVMVGDGVADLAGQAAGAAMEGAVGVAGSPRGRPFSRT